MEEPPDTSWVEFEQVRDGGSSHWFMGVATIILALFAMVYLLL